MEAFLALIVGLLVVVPAAMFFFSRKPDDEPDPQSQPEQEQETPPFEPEPAKVTVEQTFTKRVTNVALTWVKQAIPGGSDNPGRPAIEAPRPKPAPEMPEWEPLADLDGLPDLTEWDVEVERLAPAPEPKALPPATEAVVIERGLLDRVRDLFGGGGKPAPPLPPEAARPPALGQADPDWINTIPDPRQIPAADIPAPKLPDFPELELPDLPTLDQPDTELDIHVEQITTPAATELAEPIAIPPAEPPPEAPITAEAIEPIEIIAPVALQGVDDMDLVPAGRRTMAQVPTVDGIRTALRTIGFRVFRNWLISFRRANLTDLGTAQRMHRLAVMQAQRCRVKLAVATNMLLAAQADGLGPNVVRKCQETWLHAHREVHYAYQAAAATAALVRFSGGVPISLKAAIGALERDHGQMAAAARKMTVEPVKDMNFYRR